MYVSGGPLCAPSGDVDRAGRRGAGRSERGMPGGQRWRRPVGRERWRSGFVTLPASVSRL